MTMKPDFDATLMRMAERAATRETRDENTLAVKMDSAYRIMRVAGVKSRLLDDLTAGLHDTDARVRLHASWRDGVRFVLLTGPVGVGKSLVAAEVMRDTLVAEADPYGQIHGTMASWVYMPDAAALAKWDDRIDQLERVRFLVIDDLGAEASDSKGLVFDLVERLLYHRHGDRLPTIITSNLNAKQIADRYGDRIASRIAEDGRIIACKGDDLRRRAGNAEPAP